MLIHDIYRLMILEVFLNLIYKMLDHMFTRLANFVLVLAAG
jgi:hypothetical protein